MRLSNVDPNTIGFNEAFSAASANGGFDLPPSQSPHGGAQKKTSSWPIVMFLGFIFTAPYLIMKLLGAVTGAAAEENRDPKKWIKPIKALSMYNFQATNAGELSLRQGQMILIAPKEIQTVHQLINTGWALATTDNINSGLIPINYVQEPHKLQEQLPQPPPTAVATPIVIPTSTTTLENNPAETILNIPKKSSSVFDDQEAKDVVTMVG